ncbi:MAG: ATP-binding cassette domain-containing protein, partial [Deltaproteobacteria bacterium]
MPMIGMRDVCWGFGDPQLLVNITFQVRKGERICLVGRNGVGKSTLLKLLRGQILPDKGEVWRRQGIGVAALEQDVKTGSDGTIFETIARDLGKTGRALAEHSRICRTMETGEGAQLTERRDQLQHLLDIDNGWVLSNSIENVLSRTQLDPQKLFADLS